MAGATTVFKLEADMADAVNGFLRVVKAQGKTESGFGKVTKSGKFFDKTTKSILKSTLALSGAFLGARGLKNAVNLVASSLKEAKVETIAFETELTGLLSLGTNVENIDLIKESVLDMSGAFGIARNSISDTMFNLQSGAAGLSKTIQDDVLKNTLELVKVTGADMPVAMNALLKTYRIFGNETQNVNDIQNKLFKTAELGFLTFEDLAVLLPDMAAAAKTFGFSLDDVGGATITATQKLGKTSKTLTALRNIFIGMIAVQKEGIRLSDDFGESIQQLSSIDPELLLKIFGKRTIAAMGVLTENSEDLAKNIMALSEVTGDVTKEKHLERLKDMAFVYSEMSKSIDQMVKNIPLTKGFAEQFGGKDIELQLRKLGAKRGLPTLVSGLAPMAAWISQLMSEVTGGGIDFGGALSLGRSEYVKTLQRAGAFDELRAAEQNLLPKSTGLTITEATALAVSPTTPADEVLSELRAIRAEVHNPALQTKQSARTE
jgi:TP901 family phage tail tape measure protein